MDKRVSDLTVGETLDGSEIVRHRSGTTKDGYKNITQIETADGRKHVMSDNFLVSDWEQRHDRVTGHREKRPA